VAPGRAVDSATHSQKNSVEADLSCGLFKVLTEHAMLSIGGLELAPGLGISTILDFHYC